MSLLVQVRAQLADPRLASRMKQLQGVNHPIDIVRLIGRNRFEIIGIGQ